ncbi:prolipoprotein diacylglyceryl transferase [Flavobacterium sedimenticola]|uniref:Phosphatidylglycerol--prolipoprotein diacylglyceryl transferase n=1 Tax=Flavobacterium sedimenticola TaxID=3043286 RepID=A0ABT6XSY2_9FLAO|nr:prolipoprotein diacylglyceryl transferase [Flavobacterium sedimenticola]MDI9258208.1 prolipoprotein diacylglyceryl transferase [Flavobacterium sedimenticola]
MIWNPSEGIDIGSFTVRYYSLMFVIAFGLGWYLMKHIFDRENEPIEKLDTLFIWTVVATLLGARFGQVFFYEWEYFRNNPVEILLPFKFDPEFEFTGFRGLASHGAAIAIIIAMYFYSKKVIRRPMLWVLDRVVIPVASGAVFVRIGNFFNSEIYGHVTSGDHFYAVKFVKDDEFWKSHNLLQITGAKNAKEAFHVLQTDPKYADIISQIPYRHPAQLYEAFAYIFVFFILFYLYWKTKTAEKQGLLFGYFLVLLWSVRFVVEYVKESQGGIEESLKLLTTGQWLSIPFILVGIYYIFMAEKPIEDEF